MNVTLLTQRLQTLEQVQAFLDGTTAIDFAPLARRAAYDFIGETIRRFRYPALPKADRGRGCRYLCRLTGISHQHMVRLMHPRAAPFRLICQLERTVQGPP